MSTAFAASTSTTQATTTKAAAAAALAVKKDSTTTTTVTPEGSNSYGEKTTTTTTTITAAVTKSTTALTKVQEIKVGVEVTAAESSATKTTTTTKLTTSKTTNRTAETRLVATTVATKKIYTTASPKQLSTTKTPNDCDAATKTSCRTSNNVSLKSKKKVHEQNIREESQPQKNTIQYQHRNSENDNNNVDTDCQILKQEALALDVIDSNAVRNHTDTSSDYNSPRIPSLFDSDSSSSARRLSAPKRWRNPSYPRPPGGYKYSLDSLYTIGRNMAGVTMNIPTPTSITPRTLRALPPQTMPPLYTGLSGVSGAAAAAGAMSGGPPVGTTSTRYGNMPANSYILQAYMPSGSQRRLWHNDNAMWQYDRNYPYNASFGTPFGIPSLVPIGYDAQYGSQRYMYPNFYSNYHSRGHHSQQQTQHQATQSTQQQAQSTPSQMQQQQQQQNSLSTAAGSATVSSLASGSIATTVVTVQHQQQNESNAATYVSVQSQQPETQKHQTSQQQDMRQQQQQQQQNTAWRYGARNINRERFGSGRTGPNTPMGATGGAVGVSSQFLESRSYYNNGGGRYKTFDRQQRYTTNAPTTAACSNVSPSNSQNFNNKKENNGDLYGGAAKGKRHNSYGGKRHKKSNKDKASNGSSGSQSSSSIGSKQQRYSSDEASKAAAHQSSGKSETLARGQYQTNTSSSSAANMRPYGNRSYRNRMRYNIDPAEQSQSQTSQSMSAASNSRTSFSNCKMTKHLEQRSSGCAYATRIPPPQSTIQDNAAAMQDNRKNPNQYSRYYHSRQNEYASYRNYMNYTEPMGSYVSANMQEPLLEQQDMYGNAAAATASANAVKSNQSNNIETYILNADNLELDINLTPANSNDESDEPNSYPSRDRISSSCSSDSSLSKESIASLVRAITLSCIARATGTELPNLLGPNMVPYGDMTLLLKHEANLRAQQNGYKPVCSSLEQADAAATPHFSSEATTPSSVSSLEQEDCVGDADNLSHGSPFQSPRLCTQNELVKHSFESCPMQSPEYNAFLQEFYGFTPADRFLARAHLVETKHKPHNLFNNTKWDQLTQSVWNKFMEVQQTEKVYKLKMRLWRYIYMVTTTKYPRYGMYLVGSTISNFGSNSSDIDMCMLACTNSSIDPRMEAVYHLQLMRDCLIQTTEFDGFNLIEARVPILRFTDCNQKVEVDINFNNSVGIRNTHLLFCYSQLDWRLRPLVLVVKQWAQHHNINNAKNMTISSYSLVLMVIHFLQTGAHPPVLPCLHKMYPEKFTLLLPNDFGYVDMNETMESYASKNVQSIGELLVEFLRYFTFFEYEKYAISIRVGGVLPIEVCRTAKATKNDVHQWNELCIEEPFDQTNTARSVYDADTFGRIKAIVATSWRRLDQTHSLHSIFEGYVGPSVITPIESEGESECLQNTVNQSSSSGALLTQTTAADKSALQFLKSSDLNYNYVKNHESEDGDTAPSDDKSSEQQKTDIELLDGTISAYDGALEIATNKTTQPVESVAEPLETIVIKPGT